MKKQLTIAVSGLNAIDSPGPGVAVIRALKESTQYEIKIIGLAYEVLEPGIYLRDLVDRAYQVPFPSAGHEALLDRLKEIHAEEPLDMVIPNFDAELLPYTKMQDKLASIGIKTFLPTEEQFEARLKGKLYEFGLQHGIKVPATDAAYSAEEMLAKIKPLGYPVMVKGKFYEAYLAYSPEQAVYYFNKLSAKWGSPIIIQQFVKGDEYNVTAIGDGQGGLIGAVPMRKTFITDQGKAWAGVTIKDEALMQMASDLMKGTQWRGGLELEVMKSHSGEVYLIEINPRFPAWVYLAVGAGQNHPEALVSLAMGEEATPFERYDVGKIFIRYSYDMICDMKDYAQFSATGSL